MFIADKKQSYQHLNKNFNLQARPLFDTQQLENVTEFGQRHTNFKHDTWFKYAFLSVDDFGAWIEIRKCSGKGKGNLQSRWWHYSWRRVYADWSGRGGSVEILFLTQFYWQNSALWKWTHYWFVVIYRNIQQCNRNTKMSRRSWARSMNSTKRSKILKTKKNIG